MTFRYKKYIGAVKIQDNRIGMLRNGKIKIMKCPRKNCNQEAIINRVYGVLPCEKCQEKDKGHRFFFKYEFATISRSNRIQEQRDKHLKDLIQPYDKGKPNIEFFKAYPERIKDYGLTKKQLAKLT